MPLEAKDKRLQLRTTAVQDDRLRRAAQAQDTTVSEFVLRSAMSQADEVLADKRWFELSEDDFIAFTEALDQPIDGSKLAKLLAADSVFGKEFSVD